MNLQLVRSSTLRLNYAGKTILIDPDFASKEARNSLTGKSRNPMVDLPMSIEAILEGVELVIVSHLHQDHFDTVAHERVPKHLPLICQPENEAFIREKTFSNTLPIHDSLEWEGITVHRRGGHHGLGEVETVMGTVSGFVLQAANEPTVYWLGDTVMCDEVRQAIEQYQPEIIVSHSCGASWPVNDERVFIVMDDKQTVELCQIAPKSRVIATHMEAFDHATVSRADLRAAAEKAGITNLLIPENGENITLIS
jgi:L-ascorbate metabolism protein UlaG (beta-lactamase superfamily)